MKTIPYLFVVMIAVAVVLAACSSNNSAGAQEVEKQAIQAALMKYLNERGTINVAAMDVVVEDLKITGDRADAQVMFRTKQGQGEMRMAYVLVRSQGAWAVQPQPRSGAEMPHAGVPAPQGAGEMPAGHPPLTPETPPAKKPQP